MMPLLCGLLQCTHYRNVGYGQESRLTRKIAELTCSVAAVKLFRTMETHPEMFAPFERLIEIEILGKKFSVPEKNSILRGFQFLRTHEISNADLCWNGDCLNCQVWIEKDGKEKAVMSCRTTAVEGMKIVRISGELPFAV